MTWAYVPCSLGSRRERRVLGCTYGPLSRALACGPKRQGCPGSPGSQLEYPEKPLWRESSPGGPGDLLRLELGESRPRDYYFAQAKWTLELDRRFTSD